MRQDIARQERVRGRSKNSVMKTEGAEKLQQQSRRVHTCIRKPTSQLQFAPVTGTAVTPRMPMEESVLTG